MKSKDYFETVIKIERVHKLFLEVMKAELFRLKIRDINNIQALILYNLGDNYVTVGELNEKYYLGTNISYNLRNMVKNGYFIKETSIHDTRTYNIKLSEKGFDLHRKLDKIFNSHIHDLNEGGYDESIGYLSTQLDGMKEFFLDTLHSIKGYYD